MKKTIKKLIALAITTITLLGTTILPANAEWKQDSNGWWNTEGSSWSIGWRLIDNKWYCFGQDGYMKMGWYQDTDGKYYYLQSDGSMAKNIITPDGYKVDEKGIWIQAIIPSTTNNSVSSTTENSVTKTVSDSNISNSSTSNNTSSSSSTRNNKDYVSIFYLKNQGNKISDTGTGKQSINMVGGDTNVYGLLYVYSKDYGISAKDLAKTVFDNYDVVIDNGQAKLVKKSETTTNNNSSNTSTDNNTDTPTIPTQTTTSSAVVVTIPTETTTSASVTIS